MIYLHDMTTGLCIEADVTQSNVFAAVLAYPTERGMRCNTYNSLKETVQFVYNNRHKWNIDLETELQLQKLFKEC